MVQKTVVSGGSDEEMAEAPEYLRVAGVVKMNCERFAKLPNGAIVRQQESQMELAEWVAVSENCWERKTRRW